MAVGTAIAVVITLEANSRGALLTAIVAFYAWLLLGAGWLIRFLGAGLTRRPHLPVAQWLRWLAIPTVLGATLLLTQTSLPHDVRFWLSREAMDEAAGAVMAGGRTDFGWIGLYPVERVERVANGMRFLVSGSGFIDRAGFAYSPTGRPDGIDGTDEYEPLAGGWWGWVERFN
jgi:hypothetical protein